MYIKLAIFILFCSFTLSNCESSKSVQGDYVSRSKLVNIKISLNAGGTYVQRISSELCKGPNYLFGTYKQKGNHVYFYSDFNAVNLLFKKDYITAISDTTIKDNRLYILFDGNDVFDSITVQLNDNKKHYTTGDFIVLPDGFENDSISVYGPNDILPKKIYLNNAGGHNIFFFVFHNQNRIYSCQYYFYHSLFKIKKSRLISEYTENRSVFYKVNY